MSRLSDNAAKYLREVYEQELPKSPLALAQFLLSNAWTAVSDESKRTLIATAYALTLVYGADQKLLQELAKKDPRRRKRPDAARLFIDVIDSDPHTELEAREQSRRRSAWAACVRELSFRKELPRHVNRLAAAPGEGIDAWSRAAAKRRAIRARESKARPTIAVNLRLKGTGVKEDWDLYLTADQLLQFKKQFQALAAAAKTRSAKETS